MKQRSAATSFIARKFNKMNENIPSTPYSSIEEIQTRKALLRTDIQKDGTKIESQWRSLFQKPAAMRSNATPAQRISSILNTGAGVLDAFLLGWKLYRKFKW